ncbi:MAG TPA: lipocalin family protein [Candidatus Paceibacterota bacterium]
MSRRPVDKKNILLWSPFEAEWWFLALRMDMDDGNAIHAMLLIFKQSKYRHDDNAQRFFSHLLRKPLVHGFLSLIDEGRKTYTWQKITSLQTAFRGDLQKKCDATFQFDRWSCNARADGTFAFVLKEQDMHIEFDGSPAGSQYKFHGPLDGYSHDTTLEIVSPYLRGQVRFVDTNGAVLRSGIGGALYEQGWSLLSPRNFAMLDFFWAYFLLSDGSRFLFGNAPFRYLADADGVFIDARGAVHNISFNDMRWEPKAFYTNKKLKYTYPTSWECAVEKIGLHATITAVFPQQEIDSSGVFFIQLFSGVAEFRGTIHGAEITGNAYIYMIMPQRFSTRVLLRIGDILFTVRAFLKRVFQ